MNRSTRKLYLLPLVALVAIGCGRAEGHSRRGRSEAVTITRTWPASQVQELRVFEVDGSVTVEAAQTNEISLVAKASGDLRRLEGAENQGLFETVLEDGTLRIGRKERKQKGWKFHFLWDRDREKIDYALRIPSTITLDLKTVNGRITTRGGEGQTDVTTVNGPIDVEIGGSHEVKATTVNGGVRAKFTREFSGARFKTINGGVEATLPKSASFSVDLSQVNGDFEASFPLSIHSNPGSRRVSGEINGGTHELKIVTVNGDVELGNGSE